MPEAFIPYSVTGGFERGMLVRTASAPMPLLQSVRREIWAVDRNIALTMIGSLTESLKQFSYAEPRFGLVVLGVFALVGLVLVALGVYSVVAYRISRLTHDIGIRMALGATSGDVLRMVLGKGLLLVGGGHRGRPAGQRGRHPGACPSSCSEWRPTIPPPWPWSSPWS